MTHRAMTVQLDAASTVADPATAATHAAKPLESETRAAATTATAPVELHASRPSVLPHFEKDVQGAVQIVHTREARFRETTRLGAGAMGEVHRAEDIDIGRDVAIKRMLPAATGTVELARFIDEVRICGGLDHPNVVPIHDVGVDEQGRYFFVMKYVRGETLESVLEKLRAGDRAALREWTFERRVEVMLGVLRALGFAHAKGILHRDVKPANIMLGRHGEVMLMDWGVAKRLDGPSLFGPEEDGASRAKLQSLRTTRQGSLVGTPLYFSPEQARGDTDLDARSDLYTACVVFHELLALGHYMDEQTELGALLTAIQTTEKSRLALRASRSAHQGPLPAELMHFLFKGLKKDRASRYQSADEMMALLERVLDGSFAIQCPLTLMKRTTRGFGRAVDKAPIATLIAFLAVPAVVVFALVQLARMVVH